MFHTLFAALFAAATAGLLLTRAYLPAHMRRMIYDRVEWDLLIRLLQKKRPRISKYAEVRRLEEDLFAGAMASAIAMVLQIIAGELMAPGASFLWATWGCTLMALIAVAQGYRAAWRALQKASRYQERRTLPKTRRRG